MFQVTVFSKLERHRWRNEEKRLRILPEEFSPDVCFVEVRRQDDIS